MINFFCKFLIIVMTLQDHYTQSLRSEQWFPSDANIPPEMLETAVEEINSYPNRLPETPAVIDSIQLHPTEKFDDIKSICSSMKQISCLDCRTMEFCTGEWIDNQYEGPSVLINCANQTNNMRAYCDSQINKCVMENTCSKPKQPVKSSSKHVGLISTSFKFELCTTDGPKPDPFDCTRYIHCYKNLEGNYDGKFMSCPLDAPVYDAATQKCGFFPCVDVRSLCANNLDKMIAYNPLPKVYGQCPNKIKNESSFDMNLYICGQNHTFNEETVSCEPICEKEGLIPSNYDCRVYYMCENKITSYTYGLKTCPNGYEFSPTKLQCITSKTSKCKRCDSIIST